MASSRIISILLLATVAASPSPNSIEISGDALRTTDWTVAQIQKQLASEIKPVEYRSKGAAHTFNCVPLVRLLTAAGAPTDFVMRAGADPKFKNPQLRQAVIVSGRDGYTVVFSLAELLPTVGNRRVWVALDEDGKPLAESDGPVRLIVPDDKMPARAVHQIASIALIDLSAPATRPIGS